MYFIYRIEKQNLVTLLLMFDCQDTLNVDTGNLFDDIVDSRHYEADFFSEPWMYICILIILFDEYKLLLKTEDLFRS